MTTTSAEERGHPVTAGLVAGLVGFTSSFVVVLAGLAAVGANPDQAASGLLAVSVLMGVGCIVLACWTRKPITVAWSTSGAALLVSTGAVDGGWSAAVGAFLITGLLIVLTGLLPVLGRVIALIPASIGQAMLAGILLQLCLEPIIGLGTDPLTVAPVVLVWLLALRFAPRWSAPLAFLAAAAVVAVHVSVTDTAIALADLAPRVEFTAPTFTWAAALGIALPLYVVTMASQNVPGITVMKSLGYEVPWRRSMLVTGGGTLVAAPIGGHALNLAAISAALAAGPEAGPDRSRRWISAVTAGVSYLVLGLASASFATLVLQAPAATIAAVAGLALLGTFASALSGAMAESRDHIPAAITFVTAASGIAILGVSAAFWALVAGLLARAMLTRRGS